MPKKQFPITRFEGGLHTDADPRDIADNEFSFLQGFSVDSIGRLVMMGAHANHGTITAETISGSNAGYGIFPFSADYDDAGALVTTDYLALSEGDTINIFDPVSNDGSPTWNGMANAAFNMGDSSTSATDNKPSFMPQAVD